MEDILYDLIWSIFLIFSGIVLWMIVCMIWDMYDTHGLEEFFMSSLADEPLQLPDSYADFNREYMTRASAHYYKEVVQKKNMNLRYVMRLPLEQQKEYADPVTKKYGLEVDIPDLFRTPKRIINANTIGNIAWLSQFKEEYKDLLQQLRD